MTPNRAEVIQELRRVLGHHEETEHLIDWLQDAWHTYDLLIERVGKERAQAMINTFDPLPDMGILHDQTSEYALVSPELTQFL